MTNLARRPPMGQKAPPPIKDEEYLDRVRELPCVICEAYGFIQRSPTEAHHCKSGRYSQAKRGDDWAIPLCHSHHHKLWDIPGDADKIGFHNAQKTWESLYGPDHEYIPITKDKLGV